MRAPYGAIATCGDRSTEMVSGPFKQKRNFAYVTQSPDLQIFQILRQSDMTWGGSSQITSNKRAHPGLAPVQANHTAQGQEADSPRHTTSSHQEAFRRRGHLCQSLPPT